VENLLAVSDTFRFVVGRNIEEVREAAKTVFTRLSALQSVNKFDATNAGETISGCIPILLQAYRPYVRNFAEFPAVYARCRLNPDFVRFERECETDSRAELLGLCDLLVMPVQRIPRLSMLYHSLLKHSTKRGPEDPNSFGEGELGMSFLVLTDATRDLDELTREINSSLEGTRGESRKGTVSQLP
jgi:RhoGEF domain